MIKGPATRCLHRGNHGFECVKSTGVASSCQNLNACWSRFHMFWRGLNTVWYSVIQYLNETEGLSYRQKGCASKVFGWISDPLFDQNPVKRRRNTQSEASISIWFSFAFILPIAHLVSQVHCRYLPCTPRTSGTIQRPARSASVADFNRLSVSQDQNCNLLSWGVSLLGPQEPVQCRPRVCQGLWRVIAVRHFSKAGPRFEVAIDGTSRRFQFMSISGD